MNTLNLYLLSRVSDERTFSAYERLLCAREEEKRYHSHEILSLRALVDHLTAAGASVGNLDGFVFSYTISHISKEFDLLRLSQSRRAILNIELKSEDIGQERIKAQLLQNRYYLGHLSGRIFSYTYVLSTDTLYRLNAHDYLVKADFPGLVRDLSCADLSDPVQENFEQYFRAADYLISPIAEPGRFLAGQYFLTNQQREFRGEILSCIRQSGPGAHFYGIGGSAGTGKTILLYDLAMHLSRRRQVLILHCGALSEGHRTIDERCRNIRILPVRDFLSAEDLPALTGQEAPRAVLADEVSRLSPLLFSRLSERLRALAVPCLLFYDADPIWIRTAGDNQCCAQIAALTRRNWTFSGNIRVSSDIVSFLHYLFDRRSVSPGWQIPDCVHLLSSPSRGQTRLLLDYCSRRHYIHIRPGKGMIPSPEHDNVLLVLDRHFFYDERGVLNERGAGDTALRLLYETISRSREQLAIIVEDNPALFAALVHPPQG